MNRVIFLIDGFNVYHSIVEAQKSISGRSLKWLNLNSLCKSYLYLIGNNAQLEKVFYFSALAYHLTYKDPGKISRHRTYIKALRSTGIQIELGRFKAKYIQCNSCHKHVLHHEEKETDVAIAIKILSLLQQNACDTIVLLTGDTDLAPALREARILYPDKSLICAFPYRRKNKELEKYADQSFVISAQNYLTHQFPNPVIMAEGSNIYKPPSW